MDNISGMTTMLVALTFVVAGCTVGLGQQAGYYESFEDGVPDYFTATRAGSLSVSPWHYKHGKVSLRWDWAKGEELVIHRGIGEVGRTGGFLNRASFSVWLYVEKPVSDALVFEFREGDKVTGSFRFPLQFSGWRQGRPFYDGFPQGRPTAQVDNIRIAAPNTTAKGTMFLDFIKYNTLTYYSASIMPEAVVLQRRPVPDEKRFPRPERVTEAEAAGIRKLQGPTEEGRGIEDARVNELGGKVEALGIVRDEHGVRGPGIDSRQYYVASPGQYGGKDVRYWQDEHGPDGPDLGSPREMVGLARQIGSAYRASNDKEQRRRLAEALVLIGDYLSDQWESLDINVVLLVGDVLAEQGRLEPHLDAALRQYRGNAFFVEGDAYVQSNMDFYAYHVARLLRLCLVQADAREQVRWLNAWKAMFERSVLQPGAALKIDGSAYHHGGHYHSYAQNAFAHLPPLFQQLSDTPWRLSAEVHETLRRAMLAQRLYANRYDLPLSLRGRSPYAGSPYGVIAPYQLPGLDALARLGTPDGKQEVDLEVAAAYLRLAPEAVNDEPYRSLGIKPEPEPNGTFVMPYAALLCHRRDNWLASVKGQSRYVWGSERQARRNCYGLFQGLGQLEILAGGDPVTAEASGYQGYGWDWCRFEGTTVPQLPLDRIDKGWGRISATVGSPEAFVGGLSHQGRQGIFAMILNQGIRPDTTLTGRKSWFLNDEQIICLGSDISCDEAQYPTQTTLCQKALRANEQGQFPPTLLDGAQLTALPEQRELDETKAHWFIGVQQSGYCLPAGQKVTVARRHQTSRDVNDWEDTEGDFLTAWIDHGKAPSNASYEYMLVVRATPEALQRFAVAPPYQIIQRDQNAHIVWYNAARRWGCAFFVAQDVADHTAANSTLPIKAVDRPCLTMAEAVRDGTLAMSVADPDLNLERRTSKPQPLRVTLHGAWRLVGATGIICAWQLPEAGENVRIVSADAAETVLEILCQHGASYDITLAR